MKETILLTKHMRDNPEDSHLIESYEKNNGYSTAKKTILENSEYNLENFLKFLFRIGDLFLRARSDL